MLFVHAPARGAEGLAEGVLVVRAEIDYRRAMMFRQEPYPIEMWVSKIGGASFTISYEIADPDLTGKRDPLRTRVDGARTGRPGHRRAPPARPTSSVRCWSRVRGRRRGAVEQASAGNDGASDGGASRSASSSNVFTRKCAARTTYSQNCCVCSGDMPDSPSATCMCAEPAVASGRGDRERRVALPRRGWPRVSEYVVGPPQYCSRNIRNRSSAGAEVLLGIDRPQHRVARRRRRRSASTIRTNVSWPPTAS